MFTRNTVRKLPELKQLAKIATADIIFIAEICPRYIISWFIAFIKLGIQIFPEQSCRDSVNKWEIEAFHSDDQMFFADIF